MCPGSCLDYIVRDASGTPLDAAAKSFTFAGSAAGDVVVRYSEAGLRRWMSNRRVNAA
jgi:hypothetical protein